jgi:hypothetical protein
MNARSIGLGLGVTLIVGLIIGCTAQQESAVKRQPPTVNQLQPASERTALDADRTLGTPKTFQNLTLIPVYAPGAKATNAFLTLDEGLKAKLVKVREVEGGGEVNKLTITNRSQKPLYIMAGEVVLGRSAGSLSGRRYPHPADREGGSGHGVLRGEWPMERQR